jgi:ATP-dependent Lon protease
MNSEPEKDTLTIETPGAEPKDIPSVRVPDVLPVLPSGGTVVYPSQLIPVFANQEREIGAVDEGAATPGKMLGIFAQRALEDGQYQGDLHTMGTAATIARMVKGPDGSIHAILQGTVRIRLLSLEQQEPWMRARVEKVQESVEESLELEALARNATSLFQKVAQMAESLPNELALAVANVTEPGALADFIAANLHIKPEERQAILETLDVNDRLRLVTDFLQRESEIAEVQTKIRADVQGEMDKRQREFILREQLKAIQKELGEIEPSEDTAELRNRLEEAHLPPEARREADRELERLSTTPPASAEYQVIRTYLEWLADLPWDKSTEDNLDLARAQQILNEDHYGLDKVKRRILDFLAVRKLRAEAKGPILCFVGPPGTGKTSLGQSIARALGRNFLRQSLGGIRDEAEIRGHRRTYVGALPGRIIQEIRRAGSNNPLFMLDEVDKLGMDFRGDPASALLEVLDPQQNNTFMDHYLDVPFDLSKVMFITTANLPDPIPAPLLDRMEVIELSGYTEHEKLQIAKRYLLPRQMQENGIARKLLTVTDGAILDIIRSYTREAGVRNLERELGGICRVVARKAAQGEEEPTNVTPDNLADFLGPIRFRWELAEEEDEIGVATGLAATMVGGDILYVEATVLPGKGRLTLTGKLGEVMQESAQAALTYARMRASDLAIAPAFFDKNDVHVHVPAGAIPKDGPSAGVTMATALVSAITRRPVRKGVAMTGEITLRGKVLPVGAIRDKVLAAHRGGIKKVVIPRDNERDLQEIPQEIRESLDIVLAEHVDDVLNVALHARKRKEVSKLVSAGAARKDGRPAAGRTAAAQKTRPSRKR